MTPVGIKRLPVSGPHTLSSKASLLARYDEEKPRVQQTASARGEQLKAQAQDTASRLGDDRRGADGSHPLR